MLRETVPSGLVTQRVIIASNMKKLDLLALDMLEKSKQESIKGGISSAVCPCICVGGPIENPEEESSSDDDCADCGASNAHRVLN